MFLVYILREETGLLPLDSWLGKRLIFKLVANY